MSATETEMPGQPDGIADDSTHIPNPVRAAERVREYVRASGDGLYDVQDCAPLYGRDLESLTRVVLDDRGSVGQLTELLAFRLREIERLAAEFAELRELRELLAFRDREIVGHRRELARLREQLATSAEAWDTECARLRAELADARAVIDTRTEIARSNKRHVAHVTPVVEAAVAWAEACDYVNINPRPHEDALYEAVKGLNKPTDITRGTVWPAGASQLPAGPLPQRNPGQSADEVGEFPVLVQPAPIDVMQTLRTEGEKP
jgi:hypothetical protein